MGLCSWSAGIRWNPQETGAHWRAHWRALCRSKPAKRVGAPLAASDPSAGLPALPGGVNRRTSRDELAGRGGRSREQIAAVVLKVESARATLLTMPTTASRADKYLTLREAAARSGYTQVQLIGMIERGVLPSLRFTPTSDHRIRASDLDDILTSEQLADRWSCGVHTIRRYARLGWIPALPRLGTKAPLRFKLSEVEAALSSRATPRGGAEPAGTGNGARAAAGVTRSRPADRRATEVAR
jgi:hypothetical protein